MIDFAIIASLARLSITEGSKTLTNEQVKSYLTSDTGSFSLRPADGGYITFTVNTFCIWHARFYTETRSGGGYRIYKLVNGIWKVIKYASSTARDDSSEQVIFNELEAGTYKIVAEGSEQGTRDYVTFSRWFFYEIVPRFLIRQDKDLYTLKSGGISKVATITSNVTSTHFFSGFNKELFTPDNLMQIVPLGKIKILKSNAFTG